MDGRVHSSPYCRRGINAVTSRANPLAANRDSIRPKAVGRVQVDDLGNLGITYQIGAASIQCRKAALILDFDFDHDAGRPLTGGRRAKLEITDPLGKEPPVGITEDHQNTRVIRTSSVSSSWSFTSRAVAPCARSSPFLSATPAPSRHEGDQL